MPHTAPRAGVTLGSRPRWWTELPLIAVVYLAYAGGRLLGQGDVSTAVNHGLGILRFERRFNIDFESPLNDLFTHHAWIGIPADFLYASLHYAATPAVLVWLWKRGRNADYRFARTWLLITTMIGLIGFVVVPTCPPRLLEAGQGFVDTMAQYSSYGWWGGDASAPRGMGGLTNQYAAMPSLHVGWALWCGIALWWQGRSVWSKTIAVVYPLVITLVVMGTANHYFLDAAAGAAAVGAGAVLTRPALRLAGVVRERFRPVRAATATRTADASAEAGAAGITAGDPVEHAGAAANVSDKCETSARERERIPRQQGRGADRQRTDGGDGGGREAGAGAGRGRGTGAGGSSAAADDGAPATAR
ncbi:phosphatase PAP2 family protein [Streptomyces sp. Rer75]|uniref:phosphatase PAP2 family protein n=1 Tax=unclassified Streptomyces TaxID=2593676 RepID=UPI0015CFF4F1|nr:phosphatase PAP2 family protein [Streptomyces sp. Rer75]QLH21978.1 phosphatase PAP2 family protein [Streptomyces sp. Rer75]